MTHEEHTTEYLIDPQTGCWVWQKQVHQGYGYTHVKRVKRLAHRVYYERAKGPIPTGLQIDHLCRNKACVNPDHMEAVTQTENVRRGPATKLTIDQVREIKTRYETERAVDLAREFGITDVHVRALGRGQFWKEIEVPQVERRNFLKESADRRSKVTQADIEEMRRLRQDGMFLKEIAARFHITKSYVCNILAGKARIP